MMITAAREADALEKRPGEPDAGLAAGSGFAALLGALAPQPTGPIELLDPASIEPEQGAGAVGTQARADMAPGAFPPDASAVDGRASRNARGTFGEGAFVGEGSVAAAKIVKDPAVAAVKLDPAQGWQAVGEGGAPGSGTTTERVLVRALADAALPVLARVVPATGDPAVTARPAPAKPAPAHGLIEAHGRVRGHEPAVKAEPAADETAPGETPLDAATTFRAALASGAAARESAGSLPESHWVQAAGSAERAPGMAGEESPANSAREAPGPGEAAGDSAGSAAAGQHDASEQGADPDARAGLVAETRKPALERVTSARGEADPSWASAEKVAGLKPARAESSEAAAVPRKIFEQVLGHVNIKHLVPGTTEATVRLHPESLGRVDVRLHLENGHLTAQFAASTAEAREALRQHLPELHKALAAGRNGVHSMNVEVGSRFEQRERPGRNGLPGRPVPSGSAGESPAIAPARPARASGPGRLDLYA